MKKIITNIQRFCLHDGPGVRTTIFIKGCSLHCPWCANPENICPKVQFYFDKSKCIKKDGQCEINNNCCILENKKDNESLCDNYDECIIHAISKYGNYYSDEELEDIILKDKTFYIDGGGVTFSGGEPLLAIKELEPLLKRLDGKINKAVETCLFVPHDYLSLALKYINYFIIDFKIYDKEDCQNILGGNIDLYLKNLDYLIKNVNHDNILIRVPIIANYTDSIKNIEQISDFLSKYKGIKVQIFSGHTLAEKKYLSLNKEILRNVAVSLQKLNEIKKVFENKEIETEIIKI